MRRAVFLDRDGVVNRTFVRDGTTHPPRDLAEFEFLTGVVEATQRLADAGFALVVVTNQPDVARGTQTRAGVEAIHNHVRAELPVLDILSCCHDVGDDCACRKPRPGMLREAARRWNIDCRKSYLVGDRWSDVEAGRSVGCRTVLLETSYSLRERCQPDVCVTDLSAAAAWILEKAHEAVR